MKKYLLIFGLILLWSLVLLAEPADADSLYQNQVWGFSLRYPEPWTIVDANDNEVFITGPSKYEALDAAPNIDVTVSEFPFSDSFEDISAVMDITLPNYQEILKEQGMEEAVIKSNGTFMVGSQELYGIYVYGYFYGVSVVMEQYLGLIEDNLFVMTMGSRADEYDAVKPVFKQVLASMSFEGK